MRNLQNSFLVLFCLVVESTFGFQQQQPNKASSYSSLPSISDNCSRFGERIPLSRRRNEKLAWWRNNEQKQYGSFMVDSSASAEKDKKGLFDKVHTHTHTTYPVWNIMRHICRSDYFPSKCNQSLRFHSFDSFFTFLFRPSFVIVGSPYDQLFFSLSPQRTTLWKKGI